MIGESLTTVTIVDNDATVGVPSINVRDVVVDEAAQVAQFVVTLDKPSTAIVSMSYTTVGGTATSGSDFTATGGTLSFAPGQTSKTVLVPINNDTVAEADELFSFVLSAPSNGTLAQATATARITANDAPTVITTVISASDVVVSEADGYADVVVSLSAPSAESVTVKYLTSLGTASSSDFGWVSGVTLTFAPGVTSQVVRIPIGADTTAENIENFGFELYSPSSNALIPNAQATVTIYDGNAKPVVTPATYTVTPSVTSVNEGAGVTYTVNTTGVTIGSTLTYQLSGVSSADVAGGGLTGNVSIGSNGQGSFTVNLVADQLTEGNETLAVQILNGTTSVATATPVTVVDTSKNTVTPATYTVSPSVTSVNEGAGVTYTVNTTGVTSGTTLTYQLSGVSSADVAGGGLTGNVSIGSNGQGSFTVNLAADQLTEGNETLAVQILNGTTSVATTTSVTVVDTSKSTVTPTMGFSSNSVTVTEGNSGTSTANFTVTLSTAATSSVSVAYSTAPGTALSGADFVATSGTLTFNPGETSKTIDVAIVGDLAAETTESFTLQLANPTGATLGSTALATITVLDNDSANSGSTLNGTNGADRLQGTSGNDIINGLEGNDALIGGAGNDTLNGGDGTDTAEFTGSRTAFQIQKTSGGLTLTSSTEGVDQLTGIERLKFADGQMAYDMQLGNAGGNAVLVVNALFGASGLQNQTLMRDAIAFFDGQSSLGAGVELLAGFGLVNMVAGQTNTQVVATLFQNITGSQPTELINIVAASVGSGPGQQTLAQLVTAASSLDLNQAKVNLVGLAESGLVFGV